MFFYANITNLILNMIELNIGQIIIYDTENLPFFIGIQHNFFIRNRKVTLILNVCNRSFSYI